MVSSKYYDRFYFIVEDNAGRIITKDLMPQQVKVVRTLSGPCQIEFSIHPKDPSVIDSTTGKPIDFKPWGQWIHACKYDFNGNLKVWASGIVQPSDVAPDTGIMSLKAEGFSNYAKGLPWLQDWNPIAVDPFEIVGKIWDHIQSFDNGNLGVEVYPLVSGTQMLPGFGFNNEKYVKNFFAIFIRQTDRVDCGDYINKLARDIPFDYFEESTIVNGQIKKAIRLAYPFGGVDQEDLIFRLGENVVSATPKQEVQQNWFSDITIKGYLPGKEYSATLANADPTRYRRVMDETDLHIDSNERSAAWAHRLLTRRQVPFYFDSIVIDPYHPNAPFGEFDVGDLITVQGPTAWHGDITQKHKILMMAWDETKNVVELKLLAEGAFSYDPIEYIPEINT